MGDTVIPKLPKPDPRLVGTEYGPLSNRERINILTLFIAAQWIAIVLIGVAVAILALK